MVMVVRSVVAYLLPGIAPPLVVVLDTTVQWLINEQHVDVFYLGMKLEFRILQSLVDTIDPRLETCDLIPVVTIL